LVFGLAFCRLLIVFSYVILFGWVLQSAVSLHCFPFQVTVGYNCCLLFSLSFSLFCVYSSGDSDLDILLWLRRNAFRQSSTGKDYGYAVLRFLNHIGFCCKSDIEEKFNSYVVHLFKEGSSYETVVKAFYGVKGFTKVLGWKSWKDDSMALTMKGYRRWHASVKPPVRRRVPLSRIDMKKLARQVDKSSLFAVRDFVMCLLGSRAFLRASEIVALLWRFIRFQKGSCRVFITDSKTDQLHVGFWVEFDTEPDVDICVVGWLRLWHSLSVGMNYVFPKCYFGNWTDLPLSAATVRWVVRQQVASLGYDPDIFGSHSLRRGGARDAVKQGKDLA
jgi:integrase